MIVAVSVDIEDETIAALDSHDLAEVGDQAVGIGIPMPEKIRISSDPIVVGDPYCDEHASLQDEAIAMRRYGQTVEQPFEREAHQQDVKNAAFPTGNSEQADP
jgi:hypothetical protein